MSKGTKLYIGLIVLLGTVALVNGLSRWEGQDPARLLCYFAVAAIAACLKIRLPGITGTMSVLFMVVLSGIADLGLSGTLLITCTAILLQCFWYAKVRPRPIQLVFTITNISSAVWISHYVYAKVTWLTPWVEPPFRLALASSVFFVANTFPVAAVVALTERKALRQVWSNCYFWSFAYYLVGAASVGLVHFAGRAFNWQVALLILPVVYLVYRSYSVYLDRLQAERKQAEDEHRHASEVAQLHERTKEALAAAVAANARLDAAIQASPLAVFTLDRDGIVTSWNPMAEEMLGWTARETVGSLLAISQGMAATAMEEIVARTLGGERVAGMEMKQWRRDGSPFEAAIWTAPLRETKESVSGILITVADVSDRARLEEQLRLSHKMEAVGRLAGGVAHDFNNLLTVINGYSSILVDSLKANPYAAGQASDILSAGTRAGELVSQLLAFSRRQMIKPRAIDLNQLIENVQRMLRRIIGEHIELRIRLHPDAGSALIDPNQIEAVLLNLATNAQDAMPKGGILEISTEAFEIGAELSENIKLPPGRYVRLSVEDNGEGMDAETQQHIFEPFFTTKELGRGTGLGLSTVYGTIEQSGGRIAVNSVVGVGTTFSIYLPHLQGASDPASPAVSIESDAKGSETVLLVEDEPSVRQMLREALRKAGYRVWEAENGAEALARWSPKIDEVDLVVTDIVMPVMNGLHLAEELRARRHEIKVVFMSGHSLELIRNQSVPDAAPDLLQKPFLPQVLVRKVREVLDERPTARKDQPRRSPEIRP